MCYQKKENGGYLVVLVSFFAFLHAISTVQSSNSCIPETSQHVSLTMQADRNSSGHWLMKIDAQSDLGTHGQPSLVVSAQLSTLRDSKRVVRLSSSMVVKRNIPPTYEFILGLGYYKLHTEGRPWMEAMLMCEREGAHLMVIDSDAEANVVRELFARGPTLTKAYTNLWFIIGFHDRYNDGEYVTVLGDKLGDKYEKWFSGEPEGDRQDCGIVNKNAEFAIDPCTTSWAFVCEAY